MNVAIVGAAGRMGAHLIHAVQATEGLELTAAIERPGHSQVGMDAGLVAGAGELNVKIVDDLATGMAAADVLIDFTFPDVTLANLDVCARMNKMIVSGSTGFTPEQRERVVVYAQKIPVILAPNMSVGVNACFKLLKEAAGILGDDFDVEVVELHHNKKKDSPPGPLFAWEKLWPKALDATITRSPTITAKGCVENGPGKRSACRLSVVVISSANTPSTLSAWVKGSKSAIAP